MTEIAIHRRDAQRMGFFTDTTTCIGCKACEVACKQWNDLPADGSRVPQGRLLRPHRLARRGDVAPRALRRDARRPAHLPERSPAAARPDAAGARRRAATATVEPRRAPPRAGAVDGDRRPSSARWVFMSDVCKHCTNAGCLDACPTGALIRTEFETVIVQPDVCNGCGYCIPSCPFGVIDRDPYDGRAAKCTLCYDRLEDGLEPACAKACPTDSIQFGPYDELVETAKGRVVALHERGIETRLPLRRRRRRRASSSPAGSARSSCSPSRPSASGCPRRPTRRSRRTRRSRPRPGSPPRRWPRRPRWRACVIAPPEGAAMSHAQGPAARGAHPARATRSRAGDARHHARGRRAAASPAAGGARSRARRWRSPSRAGATRAGPTSTTRTRATRRRDDRRRRWRRPRGAARGGERGARAGPGADHPPGGLDVGGAAVLLVRRDRHRLVVRRRWPATRPATTLGARSRGKVTLGAVAPGAPLLVMDLGRPGALPQHAADLQAALADVDGRVVPVGLLGRRRSARSPPTCSSRPRLARAARASRPPCSAPTSAPTPASCSPRPRCRCGRAAGSSSPPIFICTGDRHGRGRQPARARGDRAAGRASDAQRARDARDAGDGRRARRCRASTSAGSGRLARRRSRRAARARCSRRPSGWCAAGLALRSGALARRAVGPPPRQRAVPARRARLPLRLGRRRAHLGARPRGGRAHGASARVPPSGTG